jgi:hypothetical protein
MAKQGINIISSNLSKEEITTNSRDKQINIIKKNAYELPDDTNDDDNGELKYQTSMDLPKLETALKNELNESLRPSDLNKDDEVVQGNNMLNI